MADEGELTREQAATFFKQLADWLWDVTVTGFTVLVVYTMMNWFFGGEPTLDLQEIIAQALPVVAGCFAGVGVWKKVRRSTLWDG